MCISVSNYAGIFVWRGKMLTQNQTLIVCSHSQCTLRCYRTALLWHCNTRFYTMPNVPRCFKAIQRFSTEAELSFSIKLHQKEIGFSCIVFKIKLQTECLILDISFCELEFLVGHSIQYGWIKGVYNYLETSQLDLSLSLCCLCLKMWLRLSRNKDVLLFFSGHLWNTL